VNKTTAGGACSERASLPWKKKVWRYWLIPPTAVVIAAAAVFVDGFKLTSDGLNERRTCCLARR